MLLRSREVTSEFGIHKFDYINECFNVLLMCEHCVGNYLYSVLIPVELQILCVLYMD